MSGFIVTYSKCMCLSFVLCFVDIQEAVHDAVKQCMVKEEPVGPWDVYFTTPVSPVVFAVSPEM